MNAPVCFIQAGGMPKVSGVSVVKRIVSFEGRAECVVNDVYVDGKMWNPAVGDKLLPEVLKRTQAHLAQ